MAKFTTPKIRNKAKPKKGKTVRRTVKKPVNTARKSKTPIHNGWTIEDYRDAHKRIPGKLYNTDDVKATKTIQKKNYGPLGRPPTNAKNRVKYNIAKAKLTPHGEKVERHRLDVSANKDRWDDKEYAKYQKAHDSWNDELARRNYGLNIRDDEIITELEDRGYSDRNRHWKKFASRNKAKALQEVAYEDWKTYAYDY